MKNCSRCGAPKEDDDFHTKLRPGKEPYRYAHCKDCHRKYMRAHYQRNRESYISRATARKGRQKKHLRAYVLQHLRSHPCADCGESDIVVLQFDHVRGVKVKEISRMVQAEVALEKLKEEIAKCEVVCANCHTRRTASRGGWWSALL